MRDGAVTLRYGEQSPGKGITNIAWAGDTVDTREQRIIVSLANGSLSLYDELSSQLLGERAGSGDIVGLAVLTPDSHSSLVQQPTILACTAKGQLSLTPLSLLISPATSAASPPSTPASFSLGDNISRMRLCSLAASTLVASGGKEQLVRLHDLTTQQCTFKAKNVKHNKLNLRTPVHTTDIVWLPNSDTQLLEGTAHHAVRLYDVRVGKQPVMAVSVGEHALTSLAVTSDGLQMIVADVTGRVLNVDRRKAAVVSAYHGIGGSVRAIALTADDSQLATASLDRHLRIYDRHTRHMTKKVYTRQKINVCLWSTQIDEDAVKAEGDEDGAEVEGAEGEEEMWRELDERRKLAAKKRRVKQEETEEEDVVEVQVADKQVGAQDSGGKRQRVAAVKLEDEKEAEEQADDVDDEFATGELDEAEADEDDEENSEEGLSDEDEEEEAEPAPPIPSPRKSQPGRRAK